MEEHDLPLFLVERAGLEEDGLADDVFADVMQRRGTVETSIPSKG